MSPLLPELLRMFSIDALFAMARGAYGDGEPKVAALLARLIAAKIESRPGEVEAMVQAVAEETRRIVDQRQQAAVPGPHG